MNKTLELLIDKYGAEEIIARILEQLKIIATCEDEEVINAVKALLSDVGCDTEYIYSLCEYTNLVTYVSDNLKVTDSPWKSKKDI